MARKNYRVEQEKTQSEWESYNKRKKQNRQKQAEVRHYNKQIEKKTKLEWGRNKTIKKLIQELISNSNSYKELITQREKVIWSFFFKVNN